MSTINYIRSLVPFGLLGSSKKPNRPALPAARESVAAERAEVGVPANVPALAAAGAGGGAPPNVPVLAAAGAGGGAQPREPYSGKARRISGPISGELPSAEAPGPLPEGIIPVIDLTKGYVDSLPDWFVRPSYKVVMGSGDLEVGTGHLDLEVFERYDVHCCLPNYGGGGGYMDRMRQENIDYIVSRRLNKIICYINTKNADQNNNFVDLFENSISRIHYVVHGPPGFSPDLMNRLLLPNGILTISSNSKIGGRNQYMDGFRPNMNNDLFSCEENYEDSVLTCRKSQHTGGSRKKRTVRRRRRAIHRRRTKRRT
jgi:hypothetical protein